jgi:spermidine synthase
VVRIFLVFFFVLVGGCAMAAPTIIHEAPSLFGGSLVVTDDGDRLRSLRFGRNGGAQSTIRVGDPSYLHLQYARIVLAGLALAEQPRRVLIVGLGGASIPVFLRAYFPAMTIDAVEIDPAVVVAARLHFGFVEDERMRAHVADGRAFIEKEGSPYDIIILDAYSSDSTPVHLTTLEFLRAVRKRLTPGGVVISSFWTRTQNMNYDAMVRTYQEAFVGIYLIEAAEKFNHVLFALQRPRPLDRAGFIAAARKISAQSRFPFDLGHLVDRGYLEVPAPGRASSVITDVSSPRRR